MSLLLKIKVLVTLIKEVVLGIGKSLKEVDIINHIKEEDFKIRVFIRIKISKMTVETFTKTIFANILTVTTINFARVVLTKVVINITITIEMKNSEILKIEESLATPGL